MTQKINQNLIDLLKNSGANVSDCMGYLLSLHFGYEPSYVPELLVKQINTLNIFSYDRSTHIYTWKIPIFEKQEVRLEWVITEYLPIFTPFGKQNQFKRECIARMQALLLEHPDLTREQILEATKLYIHRCQQERRQAKYVTGPHYFIQKGKGVEKANPILTYVDMVRDAKQKVQQASQGRSSDSITMK